MSTCRTCKWWVAEENRPLAIGSCHNYSVSIRTTRYGTNQRTRGDFGCKFHKPIKKKETAE